MKLRSVKAKSLVLAALVGTLLQFGCLGGGFLGQALWDAALYTGWEFVLDGGLESFSLGGDANGG